MQSKYETHDSYEGLLLPITLLLRDLILLKMVISTW